MQIDVAVVIKVQRSH